MISFRKLGTGDHELGMWMYKYNWSDGDRNFGFEVGLWWYKFTIQYNWGSSFFVDRIG
jgi:hypothetical protein